MKPLIFGIEGQSLTAEEAALFRAIRPAGYILFAHNISEDWDSADRLRALTSDLRALDGRDDVPILIDQEGGRVARMKLPQWPVFPSGAVFEALYARAPISAIEAARSNALALGQMLVDVGITVNCAPVLDLRQDDTHDAVGDRAYGRDPKWVAALGRAMIDGLADAGVVGVIKHLPGLGRAVVDSHHDLPHIDASEAALEADLAPFHALADTPMGMVGHIVFDAWDAAHPSSQSMMVIDKIIRKAIGFEGLLLTDDLHMEALSGTMAQRAAAAIAAGCDIAMACWARGDEMHRIADAVPDMADAAHQRLDRAMAVAKPNAAIDMDAMLIKRDRLLQCR